VDEAEKLYRRVIEIRRKKAAVTPELANALNNLADLLVEAGRPREALPLHQEALRLRRRLYPDGHAQVVASLNHLALLRLSIGDREEARELFAEAEALAERLPGRPLLEEVRKNQGLLAPGNPPSVPPFSKGGG
jgi:tetratricopeptide (TPR) repeat protein